MDISRRQQVRATAADIGARIRVGRTMRRLSQEKLAAALGITFQQVQKYESGANRVAACTLVAIAFELDLDVAYFLPAGVAPPSRADLDLAKAENAAAAQAIDDAIAGLSATRERLRVAGGRIGAELPTCLELGKG